MMAPSARALDKFYTRPSVARQCVDDFQAWTGIDPLHAPHPFIEPSAGSGAFLEALPAHTLAYDIVPEDRRILRQDFLALRRTAPAIVIGNPPFGRVSHLAVAFFNHAAGFASHIAFIVPRTFEKDSLQNRLDARFHCIGQRVLDPASFTLESAPYKVPCVFQVWERRTVLRPRHDKPLTHPDFVFTRPEEAAFAIQRVGNRAGVLKSVTASLAASSHYFIQPTIAPRLAWQRFARIDAAGVKARTAGNPSISKTELVALYAQACAMPPASGAVRVG